MKNRELSSLIRKYLGGFFKEQGFCLYENDSVYKITNQIFQGIYFNLSRWSDSFTLDIFVVPLFQRREFLGWIMGCRINDLASQFDWWDIGPDEAGRRRVFEEVRTAINDYAIPWLNARDSARKILDVEGAEAKQNQDIEVVLAFPLAHCALWEKDWELAMHHLRLYNQWFESSDDRRDGVVKKNRIVKSFMEAIDSGDFEKIEKTLQENIAYSIKAIELEKKTKKFR